MIATVCPLCQFNLEAFQGRMRRTFGEPVDLTVGFFTQLVGLALGLDERALGLQTDAALATAGARRGRKEESMSTPDGDGSSAALPAKVGVYVCHCGQNIAAKVDVEGVVAFAAALPGVTVARNYKFMCSDPGQDLIQQDIRDGLVNRVVVASCSPLMHEATFRRATAGRWDQPLLLADGEHPRARELGDRRQRGRDRQGEVARRRCGAPRRPARASGTAPGSRSTPTCWSSAAESPGSTRR